ncbi:MAG: protein-disulfide reductase DsbD, partial [Thiotrichales bacterium]|nr:protein-disulfide reductase DsbD [Thiotrichales bacterium]
SSRVVNAGTLEISWEVEPGYYLYRDKFGFTGQSDRTRLGPARIPPGKMIDDPLFGTVEISTGQVPVQLGLQRSDLHAEELSLEVAYQGCKKNSVCYPPQKKILNFVLPAATAASQPAMDVPVSEQDAITRRLSEGSLLLNVIVFFGFGLLLSLTPCVFPMIPILSGVIVGQGDKLTTRGAFGLSLIYVLAMAMTYSVLGVIAGSFHFNLQSAAQNTWVIATFSAVFVLLALSMFGFYQIQLPAAVQERLNRLSDQQRAGSYLGVAMMGILSAVIVGPCVAPPLAGALLYISQTGNALLGGLALLAMGLGFGVPLLLIGTSAGKLLPRAGAWMNTVKAVFGVLMLAVAIWFLERILPGPVTLMLWASLIMVSAVYMGALDRLEAAGNWRRLWKGLGLVMLVYGVVLILGAAAGGRDVLRPLPPALFSGSAASAESLAFKLIKSPADLQRELQQASLQGKYVMLDFYARWCVDCNEMEAYTFTDPGVQRALSDVVLLKADVTGNDAVDQALLRKYQLFGPPAILFFDRNAKELIAQRLVGFIGADDFIDHIAAVTAP